MKNSVYLPGLNGLRAIAALSVVIAHVSQKGIADFGIPFIGDFPMAGYGVTLFFVISGFLITYLLLKEQAKTDTVAIKKFYLRRILRIWPIYYLFIALCVVVYYFSDGSNSVLVPEMWYYIFFAANIPFIFQNGILIFVHYWSIGVEEQFYLFWPWVVRLTRNKLLMIAIAIFLVLFSMKLILWVAFGSSSYVYRFFMVTRFHCMMVGAIGAILFYQGRIEIVKLLANKYTQIVSWMIFILMGLAVMQIPAVFGQELIAFVSLSMILGQVGKKPTLFNLENKYFDFIGKISYGMYVIHPLVIFTLSKVFKDLNMNISLKYAAIYVSVVSCTVCLAWLSYTYFEKPFLRLKTRFAVVKSSNSMLS